MRRSITPPIARVLAAVVCSATLCAVAAPSPDERRRAEQMCGAAIRERMPYLEPVGTAMHLGEGFSEERVLLRFRVRLADSFRAEPVGEVECDVHPRTGDVVLLKVRR